jgi:two-component system sensor histidine kinase ChvG
LLDRTFRSPPEPAEAQRPDEPKARMRRNPFARLPERIARVYNQRGLRGVVQGTWHFLVSQSFSSLTRRIIFLNVAGLLALVIGILYLSQFRAGLIDARVQSLLIQGEIIAGAIAASGTADSYGSYDRDRLELQPGENYGPADEGLTGLEFSINPERVAPVLRRLISPT